VDRRRLREVSGQPFGGITRFLGKAQCLLGRLASGALRLEAVLQACYRLFGLS
jgi:hypothetical protein